MKLSSLQSAYEEHTGTASNLVRKLAFAGIAIIWIYRQVGDGSSSLPDALHLPTGFLVLSLIADLLHYVALGLLYGAYFHYWESRLKDDDEEEFLGPIWVPVLGWIFWLIKVIAVFTAYVLLLAYLKHQLGL